VVSPVGQPGPFALARLRVRGAPERPEPSRHGDVPDAARGGVRRLMPYQSLDAEKLAAIVERLKRRIAERFPGSGLAAVCGELHGLAEKARDSMESLTRPNLWLRFAAGGLVLLIVVGLAVMVYGLTTPAESVTFPEFIQTLEAGINDLVLIGLGVFFVVSLERRLKRRRVLAAISELRSIAHIVDIHQLTKDPGHTLHPVADTPSSPRRTLTAGGLARYLDYCSEMLSLTGKIAALYAQRLDDDVVLASVNEVEGLTTGLSGKIWQKMMILESHGLEDRPGRGRPA